MAACDGMCRNVVDSDGMWGIVIEYGRSGGIYLNTTDCDKMWRTVVDCDRM